MNNTSQLFELWKTKLHTNRKARRKRAKKVKRMKVKKWVIKY